LKTSNISAIIVCAFIVILAACGQEAQVSKRAKAAKMVTISVTCKESLEKCGSMQIELASAGFPAGTTMTTTIDGQSPTVFHMDYGPSSTTQTHSLPDGAYCNTNSRVYPPAVPSAFTGTGLPVQSLVQVQTTPVCYTITAPNTTKINIQVANLDQDGDKLHDYLDQWPLNPCLPNPNNPACTQVQSGTIAGTVTSNDWDGDGCANDGDPQPYNSLVGRPTAPPVTNPVSYTHLTLPTIYSV